MDQGKHPEPRIEIFPLAVEKENYYHDLGEKVTAELKELSILKGRYNIAKGVDYIPAVPALNYLSAKAELLNTAEKYSGNGSSGEVRDKAREIISEIEEEKNKNI